MDYPAQRNNRIVGVVSILFIETRIDTNTGDHVLFFSRNIRPANEAKALLIDFEIRNRRLRPDNTQICLTGRGVSLR